MKLTVGTTYDIKTLECTGWVDNSAPDGKPEFGATDGYNAFDYFDADGVYLGQDKFAIEPTFEAAE